MELDLDTFLVTVYCVIDDLYQETFAAHKPVRPGAEPEMSDSEVLTVVVLTQWQQSRSESAFLGYVRHHWRAYFPRVLSQSAFNRRARDLMGVLCALGPVLSQRLDQALGSAPPYEVLDTVPVPLLRRCRGDQHHLFGLEAAIGQGGSDNCPLPGRLGLCRAGVAAALEPGLRSPRRDQGGGLRPGGRPTGGRTLGGEPAPGGGDGLPHPERALWPHLPPGADLLGPVDASGGEERGLQPGRL